LEREPSMTLLRRRPYATILLALLLVLVLSGVVYALGRSLGYIPGIGVIDQSVPIRVLAEPAGVTREGISITVTSAVLRADQAVIFAKVQSVPSDAHPKSELDPGCIGKVD